MDDLSKLLQDLECIGTNKPKQKACQKKATIERWSDIHLSYSKKLEKMMLACNRWLNVISTGEVIIAITKKDFTIEQLIALIGDQLGPIDLWCVVYAVSGDAMLRLSKAKRMGFVRDIKFVIDERTKTWKPQNMSLITKLCGIENVGVTKTHAKMFVCKQINGDKMVSILGSSNFTKTPGAESLVILTDPRAGKFIIDWIEENINNDKNRKHKNK